MDRGWGQRVTWEESGHWINLLRLSATKPITLQESYPGRLGEGQERMCYLCCREGVVVPGTPTSWGVKWEENFLFLPEFQGH